VAKWYREHGYRFLVLSDHNVLTNVDGLNAVHGATEQFLLIKGEEVTDRFGDKPIHVNGLDVSETVEAQHGSSVVDLLQRTVDAIRKAGGAPQSTIRTLAGRSPPTTCRPCVTTSCSRSTTAIIR
jgi:predicted metal-dependent phosphoesterase TrpH